MESMDKEDQEVHKEIKDLKVHKEKQVLMDIHHLKNLYLN